MPSESGDERADQVRIRLIKERKLPDNIGDGVWIMEAAELTPYDGERGQWYWQVRIAYEMTRTGPPDELRLVVLMDGTVIQPTVSSNQQSGFGGGAERLNRS
jgi:hypothetical protein